MKKNSKKIVHCKNIYLEVYSKKMEEEFNIEIQPTQVTPDTWRSVEKIAELVKSKSIE